MSSSARVIEAPGAIFVEQPRKVQSGAGLGDAGGMQYRKQIATTLHSMLYERVGLQVAMKQPRTIIDSRKHSYKSKRSVGVTL